MPFERYLCLDDHSINNDANYGYYYQDYRHAYDDADCHYAHGQDPYSLDTIPYDHHHSHAVQLQIPQFMLNGPPILAPGGGAEVLPAGLLDSGDSFASSWLTNNGFSSFHSALISRQIGTGSTPPDNAGTAANHDFPLNGPQHVPSNFSPRFTTTAEPRRQPLPERVPALGVSPSYIPDLLPSTPSPGSSGTSSYALSNALASNSVLTVPITNPPTIGLPVYSASGFDVLSILSRVANRPNPTIQLGPVDLSCSFVIVDVRRYDCPIVYASPTFCHLTGYREQEVLGRNCRFLQSPAGNVAKGEPRRFVSPVAVSHMRKLLSSSKECQTTLVNYRKGGQAFINLVSVIPLRGGVHNTPEEAEEVAYHIGFQVDLTEQPNRILNKLRDGSYCVNNSTWGMSNLASNPAIPDIGHGLGQLARVQNMTNIGPKGGRHGQMMSIAVSKELRNLIADTTFTDSVSISTGTNASGPTGASSGSAEQGKNTTTALTTFVTPPPSSTSMNRTPANADTMAGSMPISLSPSLSLLLLEFLPDFLLVLSLKGAFLYVAPSVRLVLGYEPEELVGRSISDVCHPADLVPLMRELKEGSLSGLSIPGTGDVGSSTGSASNVLPKSVDLLFRALPKIASKEFPSRETQDTSTERRRACPSKPSSSGSSSRLPPSSATLTSNDASDGTPPPYVWLECRGRLHVEPGKGRKAIILSGRARWMPVVRWDSIEKAGGVGRHRGGDDRASARMAAASNLSGPSVEKGGGTESIPMVPLEFWALLSTHGTFLVASASVRDVLGWGTGEVIGRSLWAMVSDSRSGMRERVEAELTNLDALEVTSTDDPPPTIVTTSLVHKELHAVPVRLVFYRTPRTPKHPPPSTSSAGAAATPLIHLVNNPLCPIVCQATVLSYTEYQSDNDNNASFGPAPPHATSHVQNRVDTEKDPDEPTSLIHPSDASLFEALATARGSSWQYELQQLKFANQRLLEEVQALEGTHARGGDTSRTCSSNTNTNTVGKGVGHAPCVPLGQPCPSSSSTAAIPIPQQPSLHYTPLTHSTLPSSVSVSSLRLPNSLHEQDPPSSEWSSLAGANGRVPNPLKRSWRSEDGPTT